MSTTFDITCLKPEELAQTTSDLAKVLHACVHDGASVGFVLPFGLEDAKTYWEKAVFPAIRTGGRYLFVARQADQIVATVLLGIDLPANQQHRADIAKLLVTPAARRQGIARSLMLVAEEHAITLGKQLLVLDTRSGDPSQSLYQSLGFIVAGAIPGFCRNPKTADLEPTTYLYKSLV